MKKRILSVVSFILIFVLLFSLIQHSFYQKWEGRYVRETEFKKLSDADVDVIALGTSELWAAYDPIVTYHEQGITGYNLTVPFHSAVTAYYQLCQALEYHTPKYVICDFCSLFEDNLPSESDKIEGLYYETFDSLSSPKLKFEMLRDMLKIDNSISVADWLFPLVRYHSMWNDLGGSNLVLGKKEITESPYRKGSRLESTYYYSFATLFKIKPENWNYEQEDWNYSELSVEYYDKFIEKCHDKNITVIAVIPPKIDNPGEEFAARLSAQVDYFSSRGVYLLNYNTYDQVMRMNLDIERDYYDSMHVNTLGSVKFSKTLANDLRMYFDIPDRRNDESIAGTWNDAYEQFKADMVNSQPNIRQTVGMARELGMNAVIDVASDTDNIWSGELMELNRDYGEGDNLRRGYYVYDNVNSTVNYYEYDSETESGIADTSIGKLSRELYGDDYRVHVTLDGTELFSEAKAYYVYNVASPKFATKVALIDTEGNVCGVSSWEYEPENGNSTLRVRGE